MNKIIVILIIIIFSIVLANAICVKDRNGNYGGCVGSPWDEPIGNGHNSRFFSSGYAQGLKQTMGMRRQSEQRSHDWDTFRRVGKW